MAENDGGKKVANTSTEHTQTVSARNVHGANNKIQTKASSAKKTMLHKKLE